MLGKLGKIVATVALAGGMTLALAAGCTDDSGNPATGTGGHTGAGGSDGSADGATTDGTTTDGATDTTDTDATADTATD